MIDEQKITNAQIMNLMVEKIDRASWELRDDVALRIERIVQIAKDTGVQPDAHLSRIVTRVRATLSTLESALTQIEAMKPRILEAAE